VEKLEVCRLHKEQRLLVLAQILQHLLQRLVILDLKSVALLLLQVLVQGLLVLLSEEEREELALERHANLKPQLQSSSFKTIHLTRKETSTSLS
jgi:hypothetical protein